MFGALALGQLYLGAGGAKTFTALAAAATIPVSVAAPFTATAALAATPVVAFSTDTPLNAISYLQGDGTASVGSDVRLSGSTQMRAAAVWTVATGGGAITMLADLRAAATIPIAFPTTPSLDIGAFHLSAASAILTISTNTPVLARSAQFFASAAAWAWRTTAGITLPGPGATDVVVVFGGIDQAAGIRVAGLSVQDVLNEQANTADFVINAAPPAIGADVKIGLRNVNPGSLLFAGTVQALEQVYDGRREHPSWRVRCVDYTYLLNRRLVTGTWTNVSATTVAQQIVGTFTSGFSPSGIAGGLPTITVRFEGEPVMNALVTVAEAVGGYAYVDYQKIVRVFVTPDPTGAPDPITGPPDRQLKNDPPIGYLRDEHQLRTRILVKGAAASVGGPPDFNLPAGSTQIPIDDPTIFSSGQVITEDEQILGYTGVAAGGQGAIVRGNVPAPVGQPTTAVSPTTAGALVGGPYQWRVAFANAGGETVPGPASSPPLTVNAFPAPSFPMGLGPAPGIGPLVGSYAYVCTFVTSLGETLAGPPVTRTAQATAAPIPGAFSITEAPQAGPLVVGATYRYVMTWLTTYGETLPGQPVTYMPSALPQAGLGSNGFEAFGGLAAPSGTYTYGITIVTALGESAPPNSFSLSTTFTSPPGQPGYGGAVDANGRIPAQSIHQWACTFYSDLYGETALGTAFQFQNTGTVPCRFLIALPNSGNLPTRADGIRVYRFLVGGGGAFCLNADFRRGSVPFNYWDPLSDGENGNPWPIHAIRTAGPSLGLRIIPSSAPGVIARRVYRSKIDGSELFLLAEFQHNNDVNAIDSAFDTALTVRNPPAPTTGRAANLTLVTTPFTPIPANLVGRRLYRTQANGSVYYLLADIKDTITTSFVDTKPDDALTGASVNAVTATAGGETHQLSSIPLGPTGTLARRIYRTAANGSSYRLLTQINDNTTTTFVDAIADGSLGAVIPLTNTAGRAAVDLSTIPVGGSGVTQRVIYRTKAGGSDFLYVDTINNNADTTYTDTKADTALGRGPQLVSTIGALAGDASVVVSSAAGWPASGWVDADSQIIRYTGIALGGGTGDTLAGIPPLITITSLTHNFAGTVTAQTAGGHGYITGQRITIVGADQPEYNGTREIVVTGGATFTYPIGSTPQSPATGTIKSSAPGAVLGAIAGGTTVKTVPMLTGVSGLAVAIAPGKPIALWVVRDSGAGQSQIAAAEGGDGVHEFLVPDGSLNSVLKCQQRADAELILNQFVNEQVTYTTFDPKTRSGKSVHVALGAPQNITGDFLIQSVTISQIDVAPRTYPQFAVTAAKTRRSLADVLRHVVLNQ